MQLAMSLALTRLAFGTGIGAGGGTPVVPVPVNMIAPVISGTSPYYVGSTLTTTNGTWTNTPTGFTYQWQVNGVNVIGATTNTYVIQNADMGFNIICLVLASNASGPALSPSTSNALLAFSPLSISSLTGWYDLSDASTVIVTGSQITQVNDKSGLVNNIFNPTSSQQPLYTGTVNSRNVATFDGVNDELVSPSGLYSVLGSASSIYSMVKLNSTTAQQRFIAGSTATTGRYGIQINTSVGANNYDTFNFTNGVSPVVYVPDTNQHVFGSSFDGTTETRYIDGAVVGTKTDGTIVMTTLVIGNSGAGFPLNGMLGEVLFYSRSLSTAENTLIANYFRTKWGTP